MNRSLFLTILILGFLLIFSVNSFATVEYRVVEVFGTGGTKKEAIYDALKGALEQVNGMQMSAKEESALKSAFKETNGNVSETTEEFLSQKVKTATKGVVKQYTILNLKQDSSSPEHWTATIKATIAKYVLSKQIHRNRISVLPFQVSKDTDSYKQFSKQLTQAIISYLTQTRKFAILDRDFSKEQKKELDFLRNKDVPVEEMARIGNKLGTDFIVCGRIDKLFRHTNVMTLKRSGKKVSNTTCKISLSYRLIDIATGQVLSSDIYRDTICDFDKIALNGGAFIGRQITESIFPIAVVSAFGQSIILGQGGKTVTIGKLYKLIELGKSLVDPYTGESLGQEEIPIGLVKISGVQSKTSMARIIESKHDISKNFKSGKYIVRMCKNAYQTKSRHKKHKQNSEQRSDNHPIHNSGSKRKKISKDDW